MGNRNPVLQLLGFQAYCEMYVDHGEGPQRMFRLELGSHHDNFIFLGTNGNFIDCHSP